MGVGSHRGEISRGSPYHNYMTTNLQLVKLKKWVHFKSIWETLAPEKYTYLVYHRSHTVKTCCTSDSARASLEWILLILCRLVLTFSQCSHWLLFAKHPQWVQPCVCCISINNSRELCVHMPLFTRPCRTRQLNSYKIITACFLFSVKCLLYKFLCIERWTSGRFKRVKKFQFHWGLMSFWLTFPSDSREHGWLAGPHHNQVPTSRWTSPSLGSDSLWCGVFLGAWNLGR